MFCSWPKMPHYQGIILSIRMIIIFTPYVKEGRECMIYGFRSKECQEYMNHMTFFIDNVRAPTPDTRVNISSSLHVFHFCIIVLLFFGCMCFNFCLYC